MADESLLMSFFRGDYMPHGHCYLWQSHILLTNVVSDLLIAAAYFSIPIAIMLFVKRRPDIEHKRVFVLFSAFILCCGVTHLMAIWTIWQGVYGLHGVTKAVTAFVSIVTAFHVYRLLPQAISIPSVGQYEGVKAKLDNVTSENESLTALLADQKLMRLMLDSIPISMMMLDKNGKVLLFNAHIKDEFGFVDDLLGQVSMSDLVRFDVDTALPRLGKQGDGDQTLRGDVKLPGTPPIPIELTVSDRKLDDQHVRLVTVKSLKKYQQMKNELEESNQRLRRAIAATQDGIWEWHVPSNKMTWSNAMVRMLGASRDNEQSYQAWRSHIHPNYLRQFDLAIEQHFEQRGRFVFEYLGKNAKGSYGWFNVVGNTQFDDKGMPEVMSGALRYVQDQKQTAASEREKHNFLTAIYNGSNQAIWAVAVLPDDEYQYVAFNNTAATHTGVAIEEVVGCTLTDLGQGPFGSEMAQDLRLHLGQCVKNKKELGYTGRLAFIEGKWLQTHLYPVIDMDRRVTHVIGAAVDISAQKQIEKQLAENQAFLESLIDSAVCGLYVYDFKCKKDIQINRRYTEILGYSLDDLQRANDFMEFFHPDERDLVETHFAAVKSSRNGELLPLEYRFKHKLGHWVWCYSTEAIVALDADGEPRRLVGTFIDISERKKLIEQLQESNEYLERFAFAASHDLQEPLRKINAFSQSLAERLSTKALDGNSQFELQRLQDAANRMRLMIKELLSLSRINSQGIKPQVCSLLAILNQAREDLSLFLDEHSVSWQLPETDEQALIDPVLLRQVFQNLITNSVKFAKTGQAAKISVSFDYTANQTEIRFEDQGIGISQDGLKKIFDPFSRVHKRDDYPGSGIGLAIVQQIVRLHQGDIVCESELGQGTIFKIRLPRC